jgi:hypothetical protein
MFVCFFGWTGFPDIEAKGFFALNPLFTLLLTELLAGFCGAFGENVFALKGSFCELFA